MQSGVSDGGLDPEVFDACVPLQGGSHHTPLQGGLHRVPLQRGLHSQLQPSLPLPHVLQTSSAYTAPHGGWDVPRQQVTAGAVHVKADVDTKVTHHPTARYVYQLIYLPLACILKAPIR